MKLKMTIGQDEYIATLIDSKAVEGFITQLPLKLTLQDYAGAEKISDLPTRLSAEGSPPGTAASIGDLAYYAPWGNLAIFYKSSGFASGLIKLGSIEHNAKKLATYHKPIEALLEMIHE